MWGGRGESWGHGGGTGDGTQDGVPLMAGGTQTPCTRRYLVFVFVFSENVHESTWLRYFKPVKHKIIRSRKSLYLQARLQQYVSCELPDVQAGFRKGRGTRDQIANIHWIMEKAREFQKSIYFCFIDYAKAFDCVDHKKLWKILKEMETPDHLTCLLRNQVRKQQ